MAARPFGELPPMQEFRLFQVLAHKEARLLTNILDDWYFGTDTRPSRRSGDTGENLGRNIAATQHDRHPSATILLRGLHKPGQR